MDKISKRSEKVAFFGLNSSNSEFSRMRGFTEFSVSKNPVEYSRRYIDEQTERNDVVAYAPSISYSFDKFSDNDVHKELINIADMEKIGADAVRYIVIVDLSGESAEKNAVLREWTVIPDSEGNDADTYTYSGSLKANGEIVIGTASSDDNWQTCTFTKADA